MHQKVQNNPEHEILIRVNLLIQSIFKMMRLEVNFYVSSIRTRSMNLIIAEVDDD